MNLSNNNLEAAREAFRVYAERVRGHFGRRLVKIFLFGSAARGDWVAESDIDVLILLEQEEESDMTWLVKTAYQTGLVERHLLLQPVMMTKAEFDELVARERRFATDVLQEGIAA